MSVGQQVAQHIESVVVWVPAVAHVPSHIECVGRHFTVDHLCARFLLCGLGGIGPEPDRGKVGRGVAADVAKGLLGYAQRPVGVDAAGYGKDGVLGAIEAVVELPDIVERGVLHMPDVGADGAPAVGVTLVAERTQQHPYIAVRLVYITLVVFLGHHPLLDIQHSPMVALGVPVASHTVGFKLQGLLEIFGGDGEIVVGIVVVGESVAFTTHGIDDTVEVGEAAGAAEHEVLEQVGETSALGTLVASPDTIHHVDGYQRCGIVAVRQHRQPIA